MPPPNYKYEFKGQYPGAGFTPYIMRLGYQVVVVIGNLIIVKTSSPLTDSHREQIERTYNCELLSYESK